ncbi:hypothetical protein FGLOB1_9880 [Fusarium globosum]|uniref:Uncharacterized protein n=1 Tax=Fusarium globosum TaxID=78864 RepID=A0A8H6D408_9HYPO|nr:hypothetical protein FGLOB1_9880 [Fusarium globosum]
MSTPSSPLDLEQDSQPPQAVQEHLAQNTEQDHAASCSPPPEDRELWGPPPSTPLSPSSSSSSSPNVNGNKPLALPAVAPSAAAETVFLGEDNTMPQPQESQFDPAAAANEALKSVSLEIEEASIPKQSRAAAKREPRQSRAAVKRVTAPKRVSKRAAKPPKLLTPNKLMQQMDQEGMAMLRQRIAAKEAREASEMAALALLPPPVYGPPGQPYGQNPPQAAPGLYPPAPGQYSQAAGLLYQQPPSVPPAAPPPASHLAPSPAPAFPPAFPPAPAPAWVPTPSPHLPSAPQIPFLPQAPNYSIGLGIYNGLGQYHSAAPQPWLMQQPGLPDEFVELDEFDELDEFVEP